MGTDKNGFAEFFSEGNFWDKILKFAKIAGIKVVYPGLLLYYTLKKEDVPVWEKTTIIGALGYFINPIDAIADPTPVMGFVDDLGVLIMALTTVAIYIDEDIKNKAKEKLRDIFGDIDCEDILDIDEKLN